MASVLDTTNALITLAELKAYLATDPDDNFLTDTDNDNEIERVINAACVWANRYTGVDLLAREHTDYYDGDGTDTLFLDNFPVTSAVADIDLWIDTDRGYEDDDKISSDDIILYTTHGKIVLNDYVFSRGPQTTKITYTAGHGAAADPTNVPADIKYAIKLICAAFWKMKINKLASASSQTLEGTSITLKEDTIPAEAKEILDEHGRGQWSISG